MWPSELLTHSLTLRHPPDRLSSFAAPQRTATLLCSVTLCISLPFLPPHPQPPCPSRHRQMPHFDGAGARPFSPRPPQLSLRLSLSLSLFSHATSHLRPAPPPLPCRLSRPKPGATSICLSLPIQLSHSCPAATGQPALHAWANRPTSEQAPLPAAGVHSCTPPFDSPCTNPVVSSTQQFVGSLSLANTHRRSRVR